MSYYTRVIGTLRFSRPLIASEMRDIELPEPDLKWLSRSEVVLTDEGTLQKLTATGIYYDDNVEYGEYGDTVYGWVQDIVEALPSDVSVSGFFEGHGEEYDDLWRVKVDGRVVKHIEARIVWDD